MSRRDFRPLLSEIDGPTIFVTHKGVLRALYALATGWDMNSEAAAEAARRPRS